jgi:RHS repeat-associated protein
MRANRPRRRASRPIAALVFASCLLCRLASAQGSAGSGAAPPSGQPAGGTGEGAAPAPPSAWAAAISSLPSFSGPVSLSPDLFSGSVSMAVPILLPKGRGGLFPTLGLAYSSDLGNGRVGVGWDLVVDEIERSTNRGVDYSRNDFIYRSSAGVVDLVALGGAEYRERIERAFARLRKVDLADGSSYWELREKSGMRFLFGTSDASRRHPDERPQQIFSWHLDRVEDLNGNFISFTYGKDQGEIYLQRIDYAQSSTQPATFKVTCEWEARTDAADLFTTGFRVRTAQRLHAVEVWAGADRIRKYLLDYVAPDDKTHAYSLSTGRSLLRAITLLGRDSVTHLSPNLFAYQEPTPKWQNPAWSGAASDPPLPAGRQCFAGDLNGDARADIVCFDMSGDLPIALDKVLSQGWKVSLSTGTGWQTSRWSDGTPLVPPQPLSSQGPAPLERSHLAERCLSGDFDGDGKLDVACYLEAPGRWVVNLSTGSSWRSAIWGGGFDLPPSPSMPVTGGTQPPQLTAGERCLVGDFNRDGRSDIACYTGQSGRWQLMMSTGNGWTTATWSDGPSPQGTVTQSCTTGDLDGDLRTDIFCFSQDHWVVALSTGAGWNTHQWASPPDLASLAQCLTGDFNGDGKTDVACYVKDAWQVALSTGDSWAPSAWSGGFALSPSLAPVSQCVIGDFNGDGKTDLACHAGAGGHWQVAFSTGSSWATRDFDNGYVPGSLLLLSSQGAPQTTDSSIGTRCIAADYDGDGKTDVACYTGSGGSWLVSLAAGPASDLLTVATSSIGGVTKATYTNSVHTAEVRIPFSLPLLETLTIEDGRGASSTTRFVYRGGYFHLLHRDFRGFAQVTTYGPADAQGQREVHESFFHQGLGLDARADDPTVDEAITKGKPYYETIRDERGRLFSDVFTTYGGSPAPGPPFFNPPSYVQTRSYDVASGTVARQLAIAFEYDQVGNLITESNYGDLADPSDDKTIVRTFTHDAAQWIVGLPLTTEVWEGIPRRVRRSATRFYYDGPADCSQPARSLLPTRGNLSRVVRWWQGTQEVEQRTGYDLAGNVTCTRDPNGALTQFNYDTGDLLAVRIVDPLGHANLTEYYGVDGIAADHGPWGSIKSLVDANGARSEFLYDMMGRSKRTTQPDGSSTSWDYADFGSSTLQNVLSQTSAALSQRRYFDGLGRLYRVQETGPDGRFIDLDTEYDGRGQTTRSSLPHFADESEVFWTKFSYDSFGRRVGSERWNGIATRSCFRGSSIATLDANHHLRRFSKDAAGNLVKVEEYLGIYDDCAAAYPTDSGQPGAVPYATTRYGYDIMGNLVLVQDAKGNRTQLTYDALGQKTQLSDPDLGVVTYQYDPRGNLLLQQDARGERLFFQYDFLGRVVQKDYRQRKPPGRGDVVYSYDASAHRYGLGRLAAVTDATGASAFDYDAMGRVIREQRTFFPRSKLKPRTLELAYAFDDAARLQRVVYPDGETVSYDYNGPLLDQIRIGQSVIAAFVNYDALGQPATIHYGNQTEARYVYSRPSGVRCDLGSFRVCGVQIVDSAAGILAALDYSYDPLGNVQRTASSVDGEHHLSYDALDRLVRVATTPAAGGAPQTVDFQYDQLGNLTYSSLLGTLAYPAGGPQPHAVRAAGSRSYSYDAAGNAIVAGQFRLEYDSENRLVKVSAADPSTHTEFYYDGTGARVAKQVNTRVQHPGASDVISGRDFYYLGGRLVCDPSQCTKFILAGEQPVAARTANGAIFYLMTDTVGSSVRVEDDSEAKLRASAFLPFGALADPDLEAFPGDVYRFLDRELDSLTGFYDLGSRYYDPELGRFLSPDSRVPSLLNPQLLNRFSYSGNNPYTLSDPNGQFPIVAVLIGALVGAAVAGAGSHWDAKQMLLGAVIGGISGGVGTAVGTAIGGSAAFAASGASGIAVAGALGGAAAGGTSALLYRMAGYDVDVGEAMVMGFATGAIYASVAQSGLRLGGAVTAALSALYYREDPWQAALQGALGDVVSTYASPAPPGAESGVFGTGDQFTAGDVIAMRPTSTDVGNMLWSYGLADGYSHVLLSLGDGNFVEANPKIGLGTGAVSSDTLKGYAGRQYIKAHIDLDAQVSARLNSIPAHTPWGFGTYVCSTYVNAVTGTTWGIAPGQVVKSQLGFGARYLHFDYSVYSHHQH